MIIIDIAYNIYIFFNFKNLNIYLIYDIGIITIYIILCLKLHIIIVFSLIYENILKHGENVYYKYY